ncbi:MAG: orotate phosphoribosyltransferase [Betaproteobacteria bacterium]|nr:orotate phosphoribosyltransferase [Betaproteobacteria bacterium]
MSDFRRDFIRFAIARKAVSFGEFKTKAGRLSPYFFNSGLFSDGDSLNQLAQFYAKAILASGVQFDMLFGPAYKGIPLAAAVAVALAQAGRNAPFSFNRKEAKDHGERGNIIGADLVGRVLVVDDAISAGTAVRESYRIIRAEHATPCGVMVALDRMERGAGALSAVQEVEQSYNIPVISIATLDDLVSYLRSDPRFTRNLEAVDKYRQQYGVRAHA